MKSFNEIFNSEEDKGTHEMPEVPELVFDFKRYTHTPDKWKFELPLNENDTPKLD